MYDYDDSDYPSKYDLMLEEEHQRRQQEERDKKTI